MGGGILQREWQGGEGEGRASSGLGAVAVIGWPGGRAGSGRSSSWRHSHRGPQAPCCVIYTCEFIYEVGVDCTRLMMVGLRIFRLYEGVKAMCITSYMRRSTPL